MTEGRTPILYIAPWVDLGGSDKGTIDWFKHIDRDRWAPSLITTQPSPNRWLHHVEPYAEEVWDLPDLMPGGAFPEFVLGFIESRDVRVVHIMNSRLGFDLLPDMTCLPEPPVVVVQLHAEEPGQRGYVRYATRRYGNLIDAFSVTSEHLKETVVEYEVPPSKVRVIHSGVDGRGEFDPGRAEPWDLDPAPRRILWPGRLVEQEDPMLTLEVLFRARERGAEFVLDVVGDGPLAEPTRKRAEELGVADVIRWHPPAQEMARWYRSADLMLMTSEYEGVPYVVYESLAMGVPVVAPALPGNAEFMDGDSGALIDPRDDADAYAEAIVSLLADDERRRELGERSRRRMLDKFSLERMGGLHDELYEQLLRGSRETSRWRNEELLDEREPDPPIPAPRAPLRFPREPPPERSVGVIVPCYRHGIFLDGCIASIKAQTLAPAAIVVVDDGSDDPETVEALARLDGDPEVTLIRQPQNSGPSAARNRALECLETSYVLPIDADDELLPDALEKMLAQLEEAPEEVGFVYPNALHIGNRTDYVASPAYNVWLLMEQNYCPAPSLFDRRVFDGTGISYPEEIVVGHEDWDLILQMADRDVRGVPAEGPTFHYRKQGFSRVNAVDYGPDAFHKTIERRHARLYREADRIKAEWAPALSVVLLDEDGEAWTRDDLAGLADQTCADFELLAANPPGESVRRIDAGDEGDPSALLQAAILAARGRWVLLLPRSAAAVLGVSPLVEKLIHAFRANAGTAAVVLASPPDGRSQIAFSQIDDKERLGAEPGALAFERPLWGRAPEIPLDREDSPLANLVVGLRIMGPVQWRVAPIAAGRPPWRRRAGGARSPVERIDVNVPAPAGAGDAAMLHKVAHQPPRLPELTPGTVRRWSASAPWTPAQTLALYRHIDPKTMLRVVTPDRESPGDFRLERVLGVTHIFPTPGTRHLVHASHSYELRDGSGDLEEGAFSLGYVEDQPLPMLQGLELRRLPGSGQMTLAAGEDDPLSHESERVTVLGWIEAYPILPRADEVLHTGPWAVELLSRYRDGDDARRHRYEASRPEEKTDGEPVGYLHRHPAPWLVPLRLRADGRLDSELVTPGRASRDPRKIGRWMAAPLTAREEGAGRRLRGSGARLRHLARHGRRRRLEVGDAVTLGYVRRELARGYSVLYSTIHPVTGDQLATLEPAEAMAAGYVMDGVLGAVLDPPAAGD